MPLQALGQAALSDGMIVPKLNPQATALALLPEGDPMKCPVERFEIGPVELLATASWQAALAKGALAHPTKTADPLGGCPLLTASSRLPAAMQRSGLEALLVRPCGIHA